MFNKNNWQKRNKLYSFLDIFHTIWYNNSVFEKICLPLDKDVIRKFSKVPHNAARTK